MTKEEWLQKCADRYKEQLTCTPKQALEHAQISLEVEIYSHDELVELYADPVDAADEAMDNWTDDEGF